MIWRNFDLQSFLIMVALLIFLLLGDNYFFGFFLGKLASDILMQKWDHALEDLKRLQQFIDESTFGSSLQTLQVNKNWINTETNNYFRIIHIIRKHIFRIFGLPSPLLRKHVLVLRISKNWHFLTPLTRTSAYVIYEWSFWRGSLWNLSPKQHIL